MSLEAKIENERTHAYEAKIIGVFLTYERLADIKHVKILLDEMNEGLKYTRPEDPVNIHWKNMSIGI